MKRAIKCFCLAVITLPFLSSACFATYKTIDMLGEPDTHKFRNYAFRINKTSDSFCMDSVSPSEGILTPGGSLQFLLVFSSEPFSYCGWHHSHQVFHIQGVEGRPESILYAEIELYKKAGGNPYFIINSDPYGIVRLDGLTVYIGYAN